MDKKEKITCFLNAYLAQSKGLTNFLNSRRIVSKKFRVLHLLNNQKKILLTANKIKRTSKRVYDWQRRKTFWERGFGDEAFKKNFRISKNVFVILCSILKGLQKQDTSIRKCISLEKRIAIALYSLGSSADYNDIANLFGVKTSTLYQLVLEFCNEVWKEMEPRYLSFFPLKHDKVEECVKGFNELGIPQCFGAIDCCHFEVHPPTNEAYNYYNHRGWCSTILLALVDFKCRFLYVNVGAPGRFNDSIIYKNSKLKPHIENSDVIEDLAIEINGLRVPALIIADSAYPLSRHLMTPYPSSSKSSEMEKNFNCQLLKCHKVAENAFEHLRARFRRLQKSVDRNPKNAKLIIKTCCVLHNFLIETSDDINNEWLVDAKETRSFSDDIAVGFDNDDISDGEKIKLAIAIRLSMYFEIHQAKAHCV